MPYDWVHCVWPCGSKERFVNILWVGSTRLIALIALVELIVPVHGKLHRSAHWLESKKANDCFTPAALKTESTGHCKRLRLPSGKLAENYSLTWKSAFCSQTWNALFFAMSFAKSFQLNSVGGKFVFQICTENLQWKCAKEFQKTSRKICTGKSLLNPRWSWNPAIIYIEIYRTKSFVTLICKIFLNFWFRF